MSRSDAWQQALLLVALPPDSLTHIKTGFRLGPMKALSLRGPNGTARHNVAFVAHRASRKTEWRNGVGGNDAIDGRIGKRGFGIDWPSIRLIRRPSRRD
jgi:hypothetical protein